MTIQRDEATFDDACILGASVETNGFQGGDSGHGGYAELVLTDDAGCGIELKPGANNDVIVRIHAAGDSEMRVFAESLEWAGRRLREMLGWVEQGNDEEPAF